MRLYSCVYVRLYTPTFLSLCDKEIERKRERERERWRVTISQRHHLHTKRERVSTQHKNSKLSSTVSYDSLNSLNDVEVSLGVLSNTQVSRIPSQHLSFRFAMAFVHFAFVHRTRKSTRSSSLFPYLSTFTSIMSSLQKSTAMSEIDTSVIMPPDDVFVVKSLGIFWKISSEEKEKDEEGDAISLAGF